MDITLAAEAVKGKKIAGWTVEDEDLVKGLNLGTFEDPKLFKHAKDLGEYKAKVKDLLLLFKDVFAFTYKDMKGIPPYVCDHKIELQPEAKPVRQMWYRMNCNYAAKIKEEIDKDLEAGFIYPVDKTEWLSLIVIVPKKNGKLRVCVDYRKLNAVTKVDPFPLPFTESILEAVAGHKMYTLMDHCTRRPAKNFFHYQVRSIRIPGNAFRTDVCTRHLPKGHDENTCRLPRQIHEGFSR